MKTLRITAALILTLLAAACSAVPTGPTLEATNSSAQEMEGGGFFGGGTRMP